MPTLSDLIDIAVSDPKWTAFVPDYVPRIAGAVQAACDVLGRAPRAELSIALMSDCQVRTLNRDYRGQDKPTNVLSFPATGPAYDDGYILGDIALARETVAKQAQNKGISAGEHLTHLIIHGYLHLSGYDHDTDEAANIMEGLETKAMTHLGLANPYEENYV
ncbi:rRNA maturation RNase YbeY [Robiginitomaculum antarcticum]|uniref:rRNA maturation RNase YbeY n=1 Tax=Robiginitomaculum antarcticum TaxID=437507 RepID=UPI00037D695A|nr:rRNA maturation RNase YbeY [Robiginitomaculum antarcticum]